MIDLTITTYYKQGSIWVTRDYSMHDSLDEALRRIEHMRAFYGAQWYRISWSIDVYGYIIRGN